MDSGHSGKRDGSIERIARRLETEGRRKEPVGFQGIVSSDSLPPEDRRRFERGIGGAVPAHLW